MSEPMFCKSCGKNNEHCLKDDDNNLSAGYTCKKHYRAPPAERVATLHTPDQILAEMAETFRTRGLVYGDNWKRIGAVLHALAGGKPVTISTPEEWLRWSLHMLMVTKITRLATTDLEHIDSAHDLAVYSAMLEAVQHEQKDLKEQHNG